MGRGRAVVEIVFGEHHLDVDRRELRRGAELIALEPQVFDLLVYLVRNRDRVVSKDDLIASVWGGRIVSESTLTSHIHHVRKAIGDSGKAQRLIRTVPRKGFRFVGAVQENNIPVHVSALRKALDEEGNGQSHLVTVPGRGYRLIGLENVRQTEFAQQPRLPLPNKPSIAVLPFSNFSGDPEQDYFADGMVEEIITALSRIRWLFVIARNSSFSYKGQTIDVNRVGRELGVQYVLEGSVRKSGGRVRVTAQLIDATTQTHLWADRFDGTVGDVFDLQDRVASNVAGLIVPALQAAETARSAARLTNDLTAYDLYLRAYAMVRSSSKQIHEALQLMEQAIVRDLRYGPALAWAAVCCVRLLTDGRSENRTEDARKGADFARRALGVARDDPGVLANAALALAYFGEDIHSMITLVDRALALNPSFARGWHTSGVLRTWAGQSDIAIEHIETSLRLNPRGRTGMSLFVIGAAHFLSRRFDQAAPKLLLPITEDPSFLLPYHWLAACYAHMGRLAEARDVIWRLRSITPVVVTSESYLRNAEHRELLMSGLRLAADETT
jgi:TolB-like protein